MKCSITNLYFDRLGSGYGLNTQILALLPVNQQMTFTYSKEIDSQKLKDPGSGSGST